MSFQPCDHRWVAAELADIALGTAPSGYDRAADRAGPERLSLAEAVELIRAKEGKAVTSADHISGCGWHPPGISRPEPTFPMVIRQDRRLILPRIPGVMNLRQTVRALSSASSLLMVSLASPNSSVVVGAYSSSFSMPAKPGRIERFMKTTWRAWLACRIGMP